MIKTDIGSNRYLLGETCFLHAGRILSAKLINDTINHYLKPHLTPDLRVVIQPSAAHSLPVLVDILRTLIPVKSQHKPLRELLKTDQQSKIAFGKVMSLLDNWSGQVHIECNFENAV